jgi:hypothetical protein
VPTDVSFTGEAGLLEGVLEYPEDQPAVGGVVVAHPHPLYGGSMVQPVVHHVARSCRRQGLVTLRFNFRGVGGSEGSYSGFGEYRDVQAAFAHLDGLLGGLAISLAGYSFGAAVSALAVIEGTPATRLALVAFPVNWDEMMPSFFAPLGTCDAPILAVCGELDDIARPAEVEALLRGTGAHPRMISVAGADHFFIGLADRVGDSVATFLVEGARAV